jgi:peptidoglycan/LPS O-acetylase OafA/YrhL
MNFDYLRLALAALVMIDHYGIINHQRILNGGLSVDSFFIISGFLITRSFMNSENLEEYFKKRLARIYPPIFLVTILMLFFGQGIEALNLLFFQDFSIYKSVYSHGSFWTLVVEFQFYLLAPIIIISFRSYKIAALIALSLLYELGVTLNFNSEMHNEITRQTILVHAHLFIAGIFFAILPEKLEQKIFWLTPFFIYGFYRHFFHPSLIWAPLYPIALALLVFSIAKISYKIFGRDAKFGDLSYGVYIYHFPALTIASQYGNISKNYLALIVTGCAAISWHFLEKPILRIARNKSS